MNATTESVATRLNCLIETCRDGEDGYRAAATSVENSDLKEMFSGLSIQRHQFAEELQDLVRLLREAPETDGSAIGAMHRGWIRLRSALSGGNERAILAECERGEESAVNQYREALDEQTLPGELREALRLQFMGVQGGLAHVREVRAHF